MTNVGKIFQSTGKYEPEHWFYLVINDLYGNGFGNDVMEVETRCLNGHNLWNIDLDGYKEVSIRDASWTPEDYVDWMLDHAKGNYDEIAKNVCKNLKEYYLLGEK